MEGAVEASHPPAALERDQRFARAVELSPALLALLIVPALGAREPRADAGSCAMLRRSSTGSCGLRSARSIW